jgi:site-specific recombinase XerD
LKLLPIGSRTEQAYYACVRQLSEHYGKSPDRLSPEDLRQYCIHLKEHKKVARQTSTQAICAIKIFWEKTLRRTWPHEVQLARANPEFKLPVILSANEVRRILALVPALDHRVGLVTIYSCGLRLGEALPLRVRDIGSERMFLHLRAGKGNQDRYVP